MSQPIETAPTHLPCPECDGEVPIDPAQGHDGALAHCPYCGADLILDAERVEHSPHLRWELIVDVNDDER